MADAERLSPLAFDQWSDEAQAVIPAYMRRPELYAGPDARPLPNALGLLAWHAPLGGGWLAFNDVLANQTSLDVKIRELIILRVAWLTRSAYEWSQRVRIGTAAGLTADQLHAIPVGPAARLWSSAERAVLAASDQLIERQRVDDETWAQLAKHFDEAQLLEVLFFAGAYACFAMVCNAAGLQTDPSPETFDAPRLPDAER